MDKISKVPSLFPDIPGEPSGMPGKRDSLDVGLFIEEPLDLGNGHMAFHDILAYDRRMTTFEVFPHAVLLFDQRHVRVFHHSDVEPVARR